MEIPTSDAITSASNVILGLGPHVQHPETKSKWERTNITTMLAFTSASGTPIRVKGESIQSFQGVLAACMLVSIDQCHDRRQLIMQAGLHGDHPALSVLTSHKPPDHPLACLPDHADAGS